MLPRFIAALAATTVFATPAFSDALNSVTVSISPSASGGSGPYMETHTQAGPVSAGGSATGGFNSSGQGACQVDYGFVRASGNAVGALNSLCRGIFRDTITVTSPSVPNGTPGTLTFSVRAAGSLGASSGSSATSWHLQADLGGGAFDLNRAGTQYSPEILPGGYSGDPLGVHSATISFVYGNSLLLDVELTLTAAAANTANSAGSAAFGAPFILDWQGLSNFTANGNPVQTVIVGSQSGTDWTGAISGSPCPGDLNGDGIVDGADLGVLLGAWGGTGAADLNGDGNIDGADLGVLLGGWGACP